MSTVPSEATPVTDESLANLNVLDYPGADIILRSQDSRHFRVPKTSIIHNSPILSELIRKTLDSLDPNAEASLPVVQLPECGELLRCLLTFILPVLPTIPPTHEETMELLSVAQKYQMETVLTHIRGNIARWKPLPTLESALHIYALAQKYGLRLEALQSARNILKHSMTIEDLGGKLHILSGASLYELWKYYEEVRTILVSDLAEFMKSGARGMLTDLRCPSTGFNSSQMPSWVNQFIESVGNTPHLFDPFELNIAMTRHIKNGVDGGCECGSVSSQTMREFWKALESVVDGSYEKAESGLTLVQEREDLPVQINSTTCPPDSPDVPDANFIIRSSDLVDFRVHKPVLAMASQVFKDSLSLPQPSDAETVDGLPLVQLSEDSDLLRSLVSMLYPLHPVIPKSHEKVLYLLAACQKYEMAAVQSSIRDKVNLGEFPAPKGAEAFSAYAIASSKGLIPEMENAACQSLDYPMTFESVGEGLRLSEGWALRDLANFRKRYRDNLWSCFKLFLESEESQFKIWTSCVSGTAPKTSIHKKHRSSLSRLPVSNMIGSLPSWLAGLFQKYLDEWQEAFSKPLLNPRSIRGGYLSALQTHIDLDGCTSCTKVHTKNGETFCKYMEDRLMQARNEALSDLIPKSKRPVSIYRC